MGCTRLSVLLVLEDCLCDQFHGRIDHELGYHREFVRGIGEMEWISCQTFSLRAYAGTVDVRRSGWGSIGMRCTRSGT
jgi:hypothetical protein